MSHTEFQHYWRCEHYPSAIENFFGKRAVCEWCCHTQELRWHDNGIYPTPRWSQQMTELRRNGL
jgi:hypothetical protein